ncbi:type II secretion system protein GspI [Buttiauxella warmboldiae]|uniref:Type II secretion system protein I n=1 Tax=Buttiauxella warmboldiae TaxID=82993 RepID=A0A3N5DNL1_9ENTR|nr:type II secretion system minor pseudopilin GspI [Buttiauxella warmboldiae]RPH30135.1 type II secretion system protein GspI [Buttiauxella warmboldiae]
MSQRGMTLLEVMVAMVIFAAVSLALINSLGSQTRALQSMEESLFASWVAENQMVDLRLAGGWPALEKVAGQQQLAGRSWYWQRLGEPTRDPLLRAVEIQVRSSPGDDPRIRLRSYFFHQP